ncbi:MULTISPECIES: hypothetical protein [Niastella]|uniref:Uncharacterized protein n=1 Tax=Niastella soli TaxID=2821487 RepID=A0ABS3Z0W2_9BACT|nr:hypothetical protein [Niastella soli]MBO9203809.1 hypothetical protein [Niastella soli]
MKKIIISLFTILFVTGFAYSQQDNTDIDIVQSVFGRSKRIIIDQNMQLNENQKKSFWCIYDQYEEKRKTIEKEGFMLLKEYAGNYQTLDGTKAHKLIVNFMKSMDGYNTLHEVYFRKMEKVIGGLKAATFIQLETYIQTAVQANLQSQVPVVGELERLDRQNTERETGTLKQ